MMGAKSVWASSRSWGGGSGGCAEYACVNRVMATATMALQHGGKLFSMCMMDSQLPLIIAVVAAARAEAEAASESVTESHAIAP